MVLGAGVLGQDAPAMGADAETASGHADTRHHDAFRIALFAKVDLAERGFFDMGVAKDTFFRIQLEGIA